VMMMMPMVIMLMGMIVIAAIPSRCALGPVIDAQCSPLASI
jgi:hypothetical protein